MLIENCDFQTPCTLVLSISSAFADRIRCWLLICYDSTDIGSGSSASRWYVCTVWHLWWCMWLSYQLASLLLSMALSYQTSAFEVAIAYLVSTITPLGPTHLTVCIYYLFNKVIEKINQKKFYILNFYISKCKIRNVRVEQHNHSTNLPTLYVLPN